MKKLLLAFCFYSAIIAAFGFTRVSSDINEPVFLNDAGKAVIVVNIKNWFNSPSEIEALKKIKTSFLKNIQDDLAKEGYNVTIQDKIVDGHLTSVTIVLNHGNKKSHTTVDISKLRENGQQLAIFLDKKTGDIMSCEAEQIDF